MKIINKTRLTNENIKDIINNLQNGENIVEQYNKTFVCIYNNNFYKVKLDNNKIAIRKA